MQSREIHREHLQTGVFTCSTGTAFETTLNFLLETRGFTFNTEKGHGEIAAISHTQSSALTQLPGYFGVGWKEKSVAEGNAADLEIILVGHFGKVTKEQRKAQELARVS